MQQLLRIIYTPILYCRHFASFINAAKVPRHTRAADASLYDALA